MVSILPTGAKSLFLVCLVLISTSVRAQQVVKTDTEMNESATLQQPTLEAKKHKSLLIVGGTVAGPNDNPFQVALLQKNEDHSVYLCGGSLVAPNVVVTAAHCGFISMEKGPKQHVSPSEMTVLAGTRDLNSGGVPHDVMDIFVHPKYILDKPGYDVAVWKLKTRVEGIPFAQLATSDGIIGSKLLVTGWGATGHGNGKDNSHLLLKVSVPIVSHATCKAAAENPSQITSNVLCAGFSRGARGHCYGDSGGPATRGPSNMILAGIVGFILRDECTEPEAYSVYTRVSDPEIRDFIRKYLD
ncbi:Trypsin [Xenorhabdus vietnamensis]|uniref:Trypsin n=1 Tax=Xenorhabdus vietnamensis TaxID=351656 RepID=A0A1Y2S8Y6_9GAMM|nr:Trypsin [Xenorhabdus vietnamensis]UVN17725.1 Trypsin [Xenorhabdus vietnamensis]